MAALIVDAPFVAGPPSPQKAVDLFAGEWASQIPSAGPAIVAGKALLFEDPRMAWADRALAELTGQGLAGKSVLELGPLEGGHTYLAAQLGAREIIAIEANARAYLKCLVAKEVLQIPRATFLLGDAVAFLRENTRTFDTGLALGFIYHLADPVEALALLARRCRELALWTITFTPRTFERNPDLIPTFRPPEVAESNGFRYTRHVQDYGAGLNYGGFRGGIQPTCCWMEPDEVIAALKHVGYNRVHSELEDNPYGTAVKAVAVRD
jgi:SAM-dependent methyltransferase